MKIYLDFEGQERLFEHPIRVITTQNTDDVAQLMAEIEDYVLQGFYAVGFLSYESAMGFNDHLYTKNISLNQTNLPLLLFGIFKDYVITESVIKKDYLPPKLSLLSDTDFDEYRQKIAYIHSQIEKGNTYQTNYTIQFSAPFSANIMDYYRFLQQQSVANYCAYIQFNDYHILSISPELFFKLDKQKLTCKPMKGTVVRGKTTMEDKQQLNLLFSEKNQAENMMIVDLLRNDLSQISQIGSVKVPKLFTAEKYPTVWQLTSTIESQLKQETSLYQLFQALFPCGSITGAPKSSTMQIISEIEKTPRGVYCGSIGFIEPFLTKAIFNIPIRTLTIYQNQLYYGVGGGITWDSTAQDEYQEILAKTAILTQTFSQPEYLIETILLDNGKYFLLNSHLQRMQDSALFFDFDCNLIEIQKQLQLIAKQHSDKQYKVRILLFKNGEFTVTSNLITSEMAITQLDLAPNAMQRNNRYLYHKTANRQHFAKNLPGQEFLNYNQDNEITEFVNGNIVLFIDQKWLTPKLDSGLLNGTLRNYYLTQNKISEKTLLLDDILKAEKIVFINSVRKWQEIDNHLFLGLKQQIEQVLINDSHCRG